VTRLFSRACRAVPGYNSSMIKSTNTQATNVEVRHQALSAAFKLAQLIKALNK
jgi:hypothetical protein